MSSVLCTDGSWRKFGGSSADVHCDSGGGPAFNSAMGLAFNSDMQLMFLLLVVHGSIFWALIWRGFRLLIYIILLVAGPLLRTGGRPRTFGRNLVEVYVEAAAVPVWVFSTHSLISELRLTKYSLLFPLTAFWRLKLWLY